MLTRLFLTYTTEFKGTELADDIDDAGCEFAKKDGKYNDVTIVRNGGEANTMKDAEISALLDSSKAISGTGNGVAIEFYANDKDEVTTVVVVATYLGEVKSIKKDKDSTKADERELRVEYKWIPALQIPFPDPDRRRHQGLQRCV